jgi:hypothetical protein
LDLVHMESKPRERDNFQFAGGPFKSQSRSGGEIENPGCKRPAIKTGRNSLS